MVSKRTRKKMQAETSPAARANAGGALRAIASAWLVAGTIDITAASVYYPLTTRITPIEIYQGIASGVLGTSAFSGGLGTAVMGLAFHYLIALIWTTFFFLVYPRIRMLPRNRLVIGVLYGVLVSVVMNLVVLPASNVPARPFVVSHFVVATVILILAIGLPLAVMADRYYAGRMRPQ